MATLNDLPTDVRNRINHGKPKGAVSFVAVPFDVYNGLSDEQREQIRFFDPFLRILYQKGVGNVYIFWLTEIQLHQIFEIAK